MSSNGAHVLVTGGAGFIGSHLVDALLQKNYQVTVLDDLSNGLFSNVSDSENCTFVQGSILDLSLLEKIMPDIDRVFHLACLGVRHSIHSPYENHQVNAEGTLKLLMVAKKHEIKRFLYCSSSEIYGTAVEVPMTEDHPTNPCTVYGASKLVGENYAQAFFKTYGFPTLIIRPFNTFGPRSHFEGDSGEVIPKSILRSMADKNLVVFGDGSQTRDFTYVQDTASALISAMECDALLGTVSNIGSHFEISIKDLCSKILKMFPDSSSQIEHKEGRPGDVLRLYADAGKFSKLTRWSPQVSFDEGLEKTKDWFSQFDPQELSKKDVILNWK